MIIDGFPRGGGNTEIGGRNLILGTAICSTDKWQMKGWTKNDVTFLSTEADDSETVYKLHADNGWHCFYQELGEDFIDEPLTISFDAKVTSNGTTATQNYGLHIWGDDVRDLSVTDFFDGYDFTGTQPTKDEWKRYTHTFNFHPENIKHQVGFHIMCQPESQNLTTTWLIKNLKLERGTIATDWTPAPEDTIEAINKLDERIKTLESKNS